MKKGGGVWKEYSLPVKSPRTSGGAISHPSAWKSLEIINDKSDTSRQSQKELYCGQYEKERSSQARYGNVTCAWSLARLTKSRTEWGRYRVGSLVLGLARVTRWLDHSR